MERLTYLKDFNSYNTYLQNKLNEGLMDSGMTAVNRAFRNLGEIPLSNGDVIRPDDIIKVVSDAIQWIYVEFRTYFSFAEDANIIYLVNCPDCRTMAVDEHMNMYMDVLFIYNTLKMDKELVAAVIMHEILHVVYNHIERGKNWLSANGKPNNKANFKDTNLAADIEVNTTLVNKSVITSDRLTSEIHGLYLTKKDGGRTNMPMEDILNNEDLMNKLRSMVTAPKDTRKHIKTSNEWDDGYKEGWDKIAELLDKYGAEELMEKLKKAGIVDNDGNFISNTSSEDVLGLELITVKSFEDFLFENKEEEENKFKTYDDGFSTGVAKAISMIKDALQPAGENPPGGDGGNNGGDNNDEVVPQSNLQADDLKKLNLPKKEDDGKQQGNSSFGDNLPTNTNQENKGGGPAPQADEPDDMQSVGDMDKQGSGESDGDQNGQSGSQNGENQEGQGGSQGGQNGENQEGQSGQDGDQNGQSGSQGEQNGQDGQSGQNGESGEQQGQSGSQGDQQNGSQGGSQGGGGKGSDDGDVNKLADDLKNKHSKNKGGGQPDYANPPKKDANGEDNGIGGTGSFMDDPDGEFARKALKNSGYSDEDIDKIVKNTIQKNKTINSKEGIIEKRKQLYSKLSGSDVVKKYLDEIEVSESKYKNIWKKIMRKFLGVRCRKAGRDEMSRHVDWKNKRSISRGQLGVRHKYEKQEPQNINVYVDVSGSVNMDLLEVIAKSLVIFCNEYKYSGINIIPWSDHSCGIHKVESMENGSNASKI